MTGKGGSGRKRSIKYTFIYFNRRGIRMKKRLIILLGLLLMFALYACSDDDTSGDNNAGNDNNETENNDNNDNNNDSDDNSDKDPVKLEIGLPGGYDVTAKEIIDGFMDAHPHIEVNAVESPWGEYVQQIVTRIAGDTAPDIWFQENAVILGYGDRGVAEDLTPYIEGDSDFDEDEYVDALLATSTPDGIVYGLPHGINPVALVYNKDLFDEADIDYPSEDWTYDDMIEVAEEFTDRDNHMYGLDVQTNISQGWYPWVRAGGGYALDETLTESRFNEPETLEAVEWWADTKEKHSPTKEYNEASGGDLFAKGQVAMNFFQYSTQVKWNKEFPELDYDTVKIPIARDGENRYVPMVVNSWLIYSRAEQAQKDAAWEFLKYYLDDEAQMILAESFASLPVKKTALEALEDMTDTNPSNKKAFTEGIAEAGVTSDENPSWQEWRGEATPIFEDIGHGVLTPEEGLNSIHEKVQQVLDEQ